jgi:urease accessory protein
MGMRRKDSAPSPFCRLIPEFMPIPSYTALLRLMHLVSPTLPIGAFAFSQGLEWAIEKGGQNTEEKLLRWWQGLLMEGLGKTDAPVLLRLHDAWQRDDLIQIGHWNERILAFRETQELLDEDRQVGRALLKLLVSLDIEGADALLQHKTAPADDWSLVSDWSLVTGWSLAAVRWDIPAVASLHGYLWSWLENQVVAASKILPLPQTAAQRLLVRLSPVIEAACVQAASLTDAETGQSLPGWAMASAMHETQYSRLFRS